MNGSCLCGKISFQISGAVPRLYQCHCSLCRKQGGSSANAAMIVDAESFRWLFGESLIRSYVRPTGFRSDFCSRCGSPVPNPLRTTPYYWVPAGLLDNHAGLEIGAHLFVGSRAAWDVTPCNRTQYEIAPALLELIRITRPASLPDR